jgi:hypothetical protein
MYAHLPPRHRFGVPKEDDFRGEKGQHACLVKVNLEEANKKNLH